MAQVVFYSPFLHLLGSTPRRGFTDQDFLLSKGITDHGNNNGSY